MWIPLREPWRSIGKRVIPPIPYLKRFTVLLTPGQHWRDWIDDRFLLGGNILAGHVPQLVREKITGVVNFCDEYADPAAKLAAAGIRLLDLPTKDRTPPGLPDVERGLAFTREVQDAGGRVYVHCASGIGRSVTFAACYLIRTTGGSAEAAIARIREKRRQADPTPGQVEFLKTFASSQKGAVGSRQ